jgi:hypothetical protein
VFQLEGKTTPLEPKKEKVKEPIIKVVKFNDKANEDITDVITDESLNDVYERYDKLIGLPKEEPFIEVPIEDTKIVSESQIEVPIYKKEPVITTGKISLEDIKEIKENRGYSVPVPQSKGTNTIERIGSNKHTKDGDNNKFFFKRR